MSPTRKRDVRGRNLAGEQPLMAETKTPGQSFGQTNTGTQRKPVKKTLTAYCWCGKKMMRVAQSIIRSGGTLSCGRGTCHPPGEEDDECPT